MDINIKNCNNIKDASISVEKNSLNIKFGMNETGKSTIAKRVCQVKCVIFFKSLKFFCN